MTVVGSFHALWVFVSTRVFMRVCEGKPVRQDLCEAAPRETSEPGTNTYMAQTEQTHKHKHTNLFHSRSLRRLLAFNG